MVHWTLRKTNLFQKLSVLHYWKQLLKLRWGPKEVSVSREKSWWNSEPQSWKKVLTHISKTNAFYQRSSVIGKKSFLSIVKHPLPLFNVEVRSVHIVKWLQHWIGGRGSKCENERLTKKVYFRGVSQLRLPMIAAIILSITGNFTTEPGSLIRLST